MSARARQLHAQAAYWTLVIVAVHVFMLWAMGHDHGPGVLAWLRLGAHNASRTWILCVPALVIAGYCVHCWMVMSTGSRLVAEIVTNFWNFYEAALQFFLNDGTIVALLSVSGATQPAPNAISPGGTR